ncbi:protein KTI12 homolog [Parasteatoda tepidariorum]|uniref:protein KTI12 homolog n=1 Tax=Parasteatoda tepidariorum TaxID=114398 RepID=UPI00077FDBB3|nr:protein KTI12 homolog isoform X1 [Parasteatoda tepidariorum]
MPLVIICGLPSSGKSFFANKIYKHCSLSKKCILIRDEDVPNGFKRNDVYACSQKEKELRSFLKSQVERHLSKDKVIILDSTNYIKGYRYELYCISKGCKTTHCVIHCDLLPDDCWIYNNAKIQAEQYNKSIFDALVQRFEVPEDKNRWDSPLFTIHKDEDIPLTEIEAALFSRKAPPPNQSTQNQPLSSTNFLYDLDKITQDIVKEILNSQRMCEPGDPIAVPRADQTVHLTKTATAGDLTRIRRQFISYTKSHTVSDSNKIPNMFVHYINKSF